MEENKEETRIRFKRHNLIPGYKFDERMTYRPITESEMMQVARMKGFLAKVDSSCKSADSKKQKETEVMKSSKR